MRLRRELVVLPVALLAVACGSTTTKTIPSSGSLLPNTTIQIGPTISYSVEQIAVAAVTGAVLYEIYDPLAPNWRIEESLLADDTYRFSLRAKSFRVGGDGEAIQVIKRRAAQLQREKGYSGFRIVDYTEGIESSTPLTYRYGEGTVQLVKAPSSASR